MSNNIKKLNFTAGELDEAIEWCMRKKGDTETSELENDCKSNKAQGRCSTASGFRTAAIADYSHSSGVGTTAIANAQTVVGRFNIPDDSALFIVGNGNTDYDNENENLFRTQKLKKANYTILENSGLFRIGQNNSFVSPELIKKLTNGDTVTNSAINSFTGGKVGFLFEMNQKCHFNYFKIYGGQSGATGYRDTYALYGFDVFDSNVINDENLIEDNIRCDGEADGVTVNTEASARYIALIIKDYQNGCPRLREIEAYGIPLNFSNAFTVNTDGSATIAAQGTDDNSVAQKHYVDTQLTNIGLLIEQLQNKLAALEVNITELTSDISESAEE